MTQRFFAATAVLAALLLPGATRATVAPQGAGANPPASPPAAPSAAAPAASPAAEIGKPAPDFTLTDTEGKTVRLSDFRGKFVVLEWFNPDCPFVVHAHGEKGPLRNLGNDAAGRGMVWLAINSGAPGKQGTGADRNRGARTDYQMRYPVLLDEKGTVGKAYGAKTTPHLFIVDPKGNLVYRGGLDNAPLGEVRDGGSRIAYLEDALAALAAGRPVPAADTRPYGCSVKYGS